jgi:hypothetical protein
MKDKLISIYFNVHFYVIKFSITSIHTKLDIYVSTTTYASGILVPETVAQSLLRKGKLFLLH